MNGYLLYRKDGRSAIVLNDMSDEEVYYVANKLHRTRNKWLKNFAGKLLEDFFAKSYGVDSTPPVTKIT